MRDTRVIMLELLRNLHVSQQAQRRLDLAPQSLLARGQLNAAKAKLAELEAELEKDIRSPGEVQNPQLSQYQNEFLNFIRRRIYVDIEKLKIWGQKFEVDEDRFPKGGAEFDEFLLRTLTQKQEAAVRLRWGLDEQEPLKTLSALGPRLGIKPTSAQNRLQAAYRKLTSELKVYRGHT